MKKYRQVEILCMFRLVYIFSHSMKKILKFNKNLQSYGHLNFCFGSIVVIDEHVFQCLGVSVILVCLVK